MLKPPDVAVGLGLLLEDRDVRETTPALLPSLEGLPKVVIDVLFVDRRD